MNASTEETVELSSLHEDPRNANQHDARSIEGIKYSLEKFRQTKRIVVDASSKILAGNGTFRAAKELGWTEIKIIRVPFDGKLALEYALSDNRTAQLANWNEDELRKQLLELEATPNALWDDSELKQLLAAGNKGKTDADEVPEVPKESWVKPGQLFELGRHRLLCGDSTVAGDVERVMGGGLPMAEICWTDPPWNVGIGTHSAYGDKKKNRVIANDAMGAEFPAFVEKLVGQVYRVLKPGAHLYLAMSTQEWGILDLALRKQGFHWSTAIVWFKDRLILSQRDYHTQYEPIWYGWRGDAPRLHPLEDRKQSDVWEIPRPGKSDEHPTMKPVELVARALRNSSKKGDTVFEPFSGSGTTIIACEQEGRGCRAIELMPQYVQVAIERWEKFSGGKHRVLE